MKMTFLRTFREELISAWSIHGRWAYRSHPNTMELRDTCLRIFVASQEILQRSLNIGWRSITRMA
jgi:hypothetical protein